MKWCFWVVGFLAAGCDQTQTVGSCGNGDFPDASVQPIVIGQGGNGGSGGEGGAAPLIGDGGPCNTDAECVHAACLPSANDWSFGYCYSAMMTGCIVITDPSPMAAQCAGPAKRLFVCGDSEDVSQWGAGCVNIGTGTFGETYHCCNKL